MNKKQFLKAMGKVKASPFWNYCQGAYICELVTKEMGDRAADQFADLLAPYGCIEDRFLHYALGDNGEEWKAEYLSPQEQHARRIIACLAFEQTCLAFGIYKEFTE